MLEDLSEHTGEAMAGVYDEEAQVIMRHYSEWLGISSKCDYVCNWG